MVRLVTFREWVFAVDHRRTVEVYTNTLEGSAEACGCDACRNFAEQREAMYPDEIIRLFNDLGIDLLKEDEVSHFARHQDGTHLYCGIFYFKGRIESGRDCKRLIGKDAFVIDGIEMNEHFSIGFTRGHALSHFDKDEWNDLVQVDFSVVLPWVLEDAEEMT